MLAVPTAPKLCQYEQMVALRMTDANGTAGSNWYRLAIERSGVVGFACGSLHHLDLKGCQNVAGSFFRRHTPY